MSNDNYVVGVDLGGTKIAAAIFDGAGTVLNRERIDTADASTAREVVQSMVSMIERVSGGRKLSGVGLASPGAVDSREGIALNGTNLPEWNNVPLKQWMEADLGGVQVQVVNDANAAAWGEYVRGAGIGSQNMVYVTLSTGIGAGVILDGKLLLGSKSFAGELGHTIIHPEGELCNCGNRGCWETFSSGTAIRNEALRRLEGGGSAIEEIAAMAGEEISSRHVFEAASQGDALAAEVIDRMIRYTAIGLANVVHTFNPDRIVIGGGVSKAGDLLFPKLREETARFVMAPYRNTFEIVPAGLNDDVGLIGAASLFNV
ncbi:ROK family protein [Paenibacillus radicis (ex Gao et al. 2016)]|uniref:Glucokinase n=1 Tax=Paenibacillus radicis (ex Gao et al. 2016) TaxID=1737354 RepID=A0A917LX63_9BACL|nr:ROK family protein [Paenibacillus radicis (ex Gao et al. 2016)]GGG64887.1 glucokinase [Paenibacillus radicis (ex Gao et al. 2016)]